MHLSIFSSTARTTAGIFQHANIAPPAPATSSPKDATARTWLKRNHHPLPLSDSCTFLAAAMHFCKDRACGAHCRKSLFVSTMQSSNFLNATSHPLFLITPSMTSSSSSAGGWPAPPAAAAAAAAAAGAEDMLLQPLYDLLLGSLPQTPAKRDLRQHRSCDPP